MEHEALPQKDYARIRRHAAELVRLGRVVVKVGVSPFSKVPEETKKELKKFRQALSKFSAVAKTGNDAELRVAYSAVHDTFEQLAALARNLNPACNLPPWISLNCPLTVDDGETITLTAQYPDDIPLIVWNVSAGKIVGSDRESKLAIDTSRLAGTTIKATAEINTGDGLTSTASCEVKVLPRQLKP